MSGQTLAHGTDVRHRDRTTALPVALASLTWLALLASSLPAQELHVGVAQLWETEPTLEVDPGYAAEARLRLTSRVTLGAGFEQYEGWRWRTTPCVGLIPCPPPELAHKHSLARLWSAGAAISVFERPALAVQLDPALLLGQLRVSHRCRSELQADLVRCYSSDRSYTGLRLGLETSARPIAAWPLRVNLSAAFGQMVNAQHVRIVDGYDPFAESFSTTRVMFSVSYLVR